VKVLVVGSGAREHALVRSLSLDPSVDAVIAAPGNPGIEAVARCEPLPGGVNDAAGVVGLAVSLGVDLVVIGPEAPLVAGVADAVRDAGIPCFGPSAEAAWMAHVQAMAEQTVFLSCNSWYMGANVPGKPRLFMPLTGGFPAYVERCAQVATNGYEGFRVS